MLDIRNADAIKTDNYRFRELHAGDLFIPSSNISRGVPANSLDVYMVIETEHKHTMAIQMATGSVAQFTPDTIVEPVDGSLELDPEMVKRRHAPRFVTLDHEDIDHKLIHIEVPDKHEILMKWYSRAISMLFMVMSADNMSSHKSLSMSALFNLIQNQHISIHQASRIKIGGLHGEYGAKCYLYEHEISEYLQEIAMDKEAEKTEKEGM